MDPVEPGRCLWCLQVHEGDCPTPYCPAIYPVTGHQCELPVGHIERDGDPHHDAIVGGVWVRWCDYPLTCDRRDCDISAASASADAWRDRRTS